MSTPLVKANKVAGDVYSRFMSEVVEKHVLNERAGRVLGEKEKSAIAQNKQVDTRVIYLMSLSGKGGYNKDPELNARYAKNHNVTLLDHLLSVTRGALMLASLDCLQQNPEMDTGLLTRRLEVIAAIAFLHDLDKMLQLPRNETLTVEHVEGALNRYGITDFLGEINLPADQVRFLIEHAEDSQKHRNSPAIEPSREYKTAVERYVKLADKLDGIWHEKGAESGLQALIERLEKDQSLMSPILEQWEPLEVFDPHHPFLLDELQRSLSFASLRIAGIPPLLETHQGGRLFMLLPKEHFEAIKQRGLKRLTTVLPFNLELNISNRGIPELLNGQPDHQGLIEFLQRDLDRKELGRLFLIGNSWITQITPLMDEQLQCVDLRPTWPKLTGQMSTPYPDPASLSECAQRKLLDAAHLALLLNVKLPVTKKNGLPDYEQREQSLLSLLNAPLPEWLTGMDDPRSRRLLISLWITALANEDDELKTKIWGSDGLLKHWLEGDEQQACFNQFFAGEGVQILQEVHNHFSQLLQCKRVIPADESATGRCLFTDAPTSTIMSSSLNLYEVKVSAFSGRDGKPDSVSAPSKGVVPIGLVSLAEHKLRKLVYAVQGGKPSGVPTLVSSPITTGLFGALILNDEQNFQALSSYDLSRKTVEKGKVNYRGLELYRQRYRISRLERIPEKTDAQINTLRLLLQSCQRIGRPLHLFRGLPTPQKAFFYFDAMPTILKHLVGGNALRIEQIPEAIERLEMAQTLSETSGLGYDLLSLFATPKTRFKATALIWCFTRDIQRDSNAQKAASMRSLQYQILKLQQESVMSEQDGALVRLGEAAMQIQRIPIGQSSTSEEMLVFNLCLDSALQLKGLNIADEASLIAGIAGELETNLVRKEKMSASKYRDGATLEKACMDYATQFVKDVWQGVLGGKPPAQKSRRLLGSIYRMAFLQACRRQSEINKAEKANASAVTTD